MKSIKLSNLEMGCPDGHPHIKWTGKEWVVSTTATPHPIPVRRMIMNLSPCVAKPLPYQILLINRKRFGFISGDFVSFTDGHGCMIRLHRSRIDELVSWLISAKDRMESNLKETDLDVLQGSE